MGKKLLGSAAVALLTFAAAWGTYITVLTAGARSRGDVPYALAVIAAMIIELVIYKIIKLFMKGIRRWLSSAMGALLPMLVLTLAFNGGENAEALGKGSNAVLFGAMVGFAFASGFRLFLGRFIPERKRPSFWDLADDVTDEPADDQKQNDTKKS